jgi:hypothetical protein
MTTRRDFLKGAALAIVPSPVLAAPLGAEARRKYVIPLQDAVDIYGSERLSRYGRVVVKDGRYWLVLP